MRHVPRVASMVLIALTPVSSAGILPSTTYELGPYRIDGFAQDCEFVADHVTVTGFTGEVNGVPKIHVRLQFWPVSGIPVCFFFFPPPQAAFSFEGVGYGTALP